MDYLKCIKVGALLLLAPSCFAAQQKTSQIYLGDEWVTVRSESVENPLLASKLFQFNPGAFATNLAQRFLSSNAKLLGLNAQTELLATETVEGDVLQTVRLKKNYHGLEVMGGEALIHLQNNSIDFMSADDTSLDGLSPAASVAADTASAIALSSYNGQARSIDAPQLFVFIPPPSSGDEKKEAHLVYQVRVRGIDGLSSDLHYVDAQTAQEVLVTSDVQTIKDRTVLAGSGTTDDFDLDISAYKLVLADKGCAARPSSFFDGMFGNSNRLSTGDPIEEDVLSAKNTSGSRSLSATAAPKPCTRVTAPVLAAAKHAMDNSGLTYDYYLAKHGRNSIDNHGMQIRSVVNFANNWGNAAWVNERKIMVYGTGEDPSTQNDFSVALDVAAHELTHGLTSSSAKLLYAAQPGALNESYSDIFGKLVAFANNRGNDWILGRELFKNGREFVRDLANPTVGHMRDLLYKDSSCNQFNDFCGVHDNSGIPSKAAVLLAGKIGLEKLGKIYYLTLTQLLRPNASFKDAKAQSIQACKKLFPTANAPECTAITQSFAAVGI